MATKINVQGTLTPSVSDTPLDYRTRVDYTNDIETIPLAWIGMHVYSKEDGKEYIIKRLQPGVVGGREIPNYYPAPKSQGGYEEFLGGGGSPSPTPTPTPTDLTAGDIYFNGSDIYSSNTVGKELQNLASDILNLAESIHNLSGDIGTLSNLNTENKQDLVAAINEVLASTSSTIAVVDNLVSNSTTDALSAYQGKVLKGLVDGKVAGIKVQGESSVLPMDSNGIVTIPAGGGGGTGTITGATVGGNPVTESGGILQFDAYPTVPIKSIQVDGAQNPLNPDSSGKVTIPAQPNVPITGINDANGNALTPVQGIVTLPQAAAAPTADTMTYNNSTTYSSGSIGKALHDTITALGYEYSTSSTIATNPSHNMYYDLTGSAISALDVSGVSPTNDKEIIILFLTSSGGCSITLAETPIPQRIIGSTALANSQVYIMSILRGIVCLVEAPAFVAPVAVLSSEPE